jgi:hypothetical protein
VALPATSIILLQPVVPRGLTSHSPHKVLLSSAPTGSCKEVLGKRGLQPSGAKSALWDLGVCVSAQTQACLQRRSG